MSAPIALSTSRGWLAELRCVSELAAITGAIDGAVAVEADGELRIAGCVAGTFPRRTISPGLCEPAADSLLPAGGHWLDRVALAQLRFPPDSCVLVLPVASNHWSGAVLLRYAAPPHLSAYDLAGLRASLARFLEVADAPPLAA